jgi:hypothetical protein
LERDSTPIIHGTIIIVVAKGINFRVMAIVLAITNAAKSQPVGRFQTMILIGNGVQIGERGEMLSSIVKKMDRLTHHRQSFLRLLQI